MQLTVPLASSLLSAGGSSAASQITRILRSWTADLVAFSNCDVVIEGSLIIFRSTYDRADIREFHVLGDRYSLNEELVLALRIRSWLIFHGLQ